MAWPMQNTGQWNPNMVMGPGPDMSMGSYTAAQWAAIQQQNWQWSQWQQQYAQWQSQYGEQYTEQMQAIQAMGGMPPLPPVNTVAPPAPPPPEKPPPPPPHENNQPLFGNIVSQPTPVPAPNITQQRNNNSATANVNIQAGDKNRTYPQGATAASVNAEALKKLAEEERLFDIQFQKWEEEIEKWKKDNLNHPDKQAYREYEEKFEACRAQLLERRQQMNKKRACLMENTPPPLPPQTANTTADTLNAALPSVQNVHVDTFLSNSQQNYGNNSAQKPNKKTHFGDSMPQNYIAQKNTQYQQQYNASPNPYGRNSNATKETDAKYQYSQNDQYNKDSIIAPPKNPSFLLASESNKKGIPGLDLVPETEKFVLNSKQADVIDITDDNIPRGPDYTTISKGINSILGDEKIMNILSMVRGQVVPDLMSKAPPFQTSQSGHYSANNTSYEQSPRNQQFDSRPNNAQHHSPGNVLPIHTNPLGPRPPPLLNRKIEDQDGMPQQQYDSYDGRPQYGDNNMGQMYDRGFPPVRPNLLGPRPTIRPLLQNISIQNVCPRNISNSGQQNITDFSRVAPGQGHQNVTDFPRTTSSVPPNDYSRAPPGAGQQNDYSRAPPGSDQQNEFSRAPSNDTQQNDYSRAPPNASQQNDYLRDPLNAVQQNEFSQAPPIQNDYSRAPPVAGQQFIHDYSRGLPGPSERMSSIANNVAHNVSQPVRPKWVDEPMFSPSIIVEYEHMPLRLKARDFIEPVHMFEYNHKAKDEGRKDFEKEVGNIFTRKPRRSEKDLDYGGRYNRDFSSRDFERRTPREDMLDQIRLRGPPRDDYDDRRRLDEDRRRLDRFDDKRRDDRVKFTRRDDMYRENDRDFQRDRDRGRDSRRDENRKDDSRRDSRRDDYRRDDEKNRRDDNRIRSRSRDRDSKKRGLSRDNENDTSSKRPREKDPVVPASQFEQPKHIVMIDDLLELPGREMRPEKIVIILRGPPGSGKSFLAKLIRDKEAENGGTVRIMSIDDYFMQEGEIEERDPATGKMIKKPTLKYEYDEKYEETYVNSLKRAYKRCLTDGYFSFIVYDAVNDTLKSYADVWNLARQNDFQAYICTMELDPQLCLKRNIHNRKLEDIEVICARFFPTPAHHIQLDCTTLLQSGAITEVQMEDADVEVIMEDAQEPEVENVFTSKWEMMDDAAQLARLDGTSKPLRSSQLSMEDYLQLDEWKPNIAKPGKKTVRWADIEERRQQEKMRAIGFVVGQTDWNRMTDPTMGSSALTQTKYIERVRRH